MAGLSAKMPSASTGDGAVMAGAGESLSAKVRVLFHQGRWRGADRHPSSSCSRSSSVRRQKVRSSSSPRAIGQDDRQGDLALAEIVADGLAQLFLARRIIEHIVDQLEGDAEIEAIGFQRVFLDLGPLGHHGADAAGGGEQGGGLGADHVEIGVFGGVGVVGGDRAAAPRPRRSPTRRATGCASTCSEPSSTISSKARAEQEVAHQHVALLPHTALAEARPRRRSLSSTTSSCSRVAVWMNSTQAASLMWRSPAIAAELGRGQGQHRPQALAAGGDDMAGQVRESARPGCACAR